ncbi:MAG: hydrogenase maturation protease [Planctomycetes bacterium]|nr:hydrogenase maturation protease [Planctomycetota bacterium]
MDDAPRVLLIGYGNPARGDDGLGPAVAEAIASRGLHGVTVEWPFHLQVEDAATIAAHDLVVLVDADTECEAPYAVRRIEPAGGPSWTTHTLAPPAVLALARDVFGATPPAVLIGVRGYEFEAFHEGLSTGARDNLAATLDWLEPRLREHARDLLPPLATASIEG